MVVAVAFAVSLGVRASSVVNDGNGVDFHFGFPREFLDGDGYASRRISLEIATIHFVHFGEVFHVLPHKQSYHKIDGALQNPLQA